MWTSFPHALTRMLLGCLSTVNPCLGGTSSIWLCKSKSFDSLFFVCFYLGAIFLENYNL